MVGSDCRGGGGRFHRATFGVILGLVLAAACWLPADAQILPPGILPPGYRTPQPGWIAGDVSVAGVATLSRPMPLIDNACSGYVLSFNDPVAPAGALDIGGDAFVGTVSVSFSINACLDIIWGGGGYFGGASGSIQGTSVNGSSFSCTINSGEVWAENPGYTIIDMGGSCSVDGAPSPYYMTIDYQGTFIPTVDPGTQSSGGAVLVGTIDVETVW